jgi:adenylate kinase family enzyme
MNDNQQKKQAYLFIGRSGSGKGTQSKKLIEEYLKPKGDNIYYLETGEGFRKFMKGEKYSNNLARTYSLSPEFLAVWVWSTFLIENLEENQTLVLDGVARKILEAPVLESAFNFYGYEKVNIMYINVPREVARQRMVDRGRPDDLNPAEVEKRLNWFESDVAPVIEFFRSSPRYNFIEINGDQDVEGVHTEVVAKLENSK